MKLNLNEYWRKFATFIPLRNPIPGLLTRYSHDSHQHISTIWKAGSKTNAALQNLKIIR